MAVDMGRGFWGGRAAYIGGRPILGGGEEAMSESPGPNWSNFFFIRVNPARTGQTFFYPSPKNAAKVG